tara:strand:+ start:47 stop:265 length:219 start_codon:yes stop_codon:yes gene_type:complete
MKDIFKTIDWEKRHSGEHPIIIIQKRLKNAIKSNAHPKIIKMLENKLNDEIELTNLIYSQSKRFQSFILCMI